jgi:tetratricopeptide (TPR) repeat protein
MQLEKPVSFPSPSSSNLPPAPLSSQEKPVSSEQLPFETIPGGQGIPGTLRSPQAGFSSPEQIPLPDFPALQEQSEMLDAPTLREQPGISNPTLPPQEVQNWESFGSSQSLEQFSFSDAQKIATQPNIPGVSISQPLHGASNPDYLPGESQSSGPAAPYAYPTQQGFANLGSEALPYMQTQMPPLNMYPPAISSASMAPPPPVVREPQVRRLAKPLPMWAFILSIVVVIAIFAILFFTGSDWATGAMHTGIVGGILAILILLATIVRTLAGMAARSNPKRRVQFISAGLLVLILLLVSGVSLTQQASIHQVQGHFLEGQQQWQNAITEFQRDGEHAPNSDNIARTYDEWGEMLSNAAHYDTSIDKFNTVLDTYSLATGEVTRAQSDKVAAYLNWGRQASQQHDYNDATTHFNDLLNLPYCNANCQAETSALDAMAYYDQAEMQLTGQQYDSAVNTFQSLTTLFPKSPEAQKDHKDYAKALFGQGKQQLTTSCPNAIPTYQELSSKFGDTPEGQLATTALKAPQEVKGRFTTSVPKSSALTVLAVLAQGLHANIGNTQFFQLIAGAPSVVIKADGSFTFKSVKQGTYDLAWGTNNVDGSQSFYFYYRPSDNSLVYIANVGPLCAFDFGNINLPIPVAP